MVDTKSLEETKQNWKNSHTRVPAAYKSGIQRTTGWKEKAIAGEDLYAENVQAAIANRSRAKALEQTSEEVWKNNAATKGSERIARGMAASEGKFSSGMAKNLETIKGVTIAPRTSDPMANIDNRVKPIAKALYDQKRRG